MTSYLVLTAEIAQVVRQSAYL